MFYKSQFGFGENYSTKLAVAQLYNEIIENLENNNISCSIFLDLTKAFDTVDHKILLNKLHKYGIRGEPHKLLASYLKIRQQCTITIESGYFQRTVKKGCLKANCRYSGIGVFCSYKVLLV